MLSKYSPKRTKLHHLIFFSWDHAPVPLSKRVAFLHVRAAWRLIDVMYVNTR